MIPTEPPKDRVEDTGADAHIPDGGAGTVMSIGICLVLLGAAMLGLVMVQASVAAVRAATAADLAALAGADTLRGLGPPVPQAGKPENGPGGGTPDMADGMGPGAACAAAGETAARNGARLTSCTVDAARGAVTVEAEVRGPVLPGPASARARAGPPS